MSKPPSAPSRRLPPSASPTAAQRPLPTLLNRSRHNDCHSKMATIIRKDTGYLSTSGPQVQSVAFSFADLHGQASDYLETVRQEAAKLVQQAHREAEQIRRQAEAAGRKA